LGVLSAHTGLLFPFIMPIGFGAHDQLRRDPAYNVTRHLFQLAVALLLGLTFIRLGHDQQDLNCSSRVAGVHFCLFFIDRVSSIYFAAFVRYRAQPAHSFMVD
jgi:hypothetical protein